MKITRRTFQDFASAYNSFDEIPENKRLQKYESEFTGVDVWGQYFEDQYGNEDDWSDGHLKEVSRAGDQWQECCDEYGCHHALASPTIVDQWCQDLVQRMKMENARSNYLSYVNHFYRYLMWHIDFPHIYNPVQFAIQSHQTASDVWNAKQYEDER